MAPRRLDAAQRALAVRAYSPACGERITAASPSKQPASLLFQFADEADHNEAPQEMETEKNKQENPEAETEVVAGRELSLRRRQPFAALVGFHLHVGISTAIEGLHHDAFVRHQHR